MCCLIVKYVYIYSYTHTLLIYLSLVDEQHSTVSREANCSIFTDDDETEETISDGSLG